MRVILIILCGLMVLFAGGCALLFLAGSGFNGMFRSVPGGNIPGVIAALNVLVLLALFGFAKPQRWAFYILAVLDVLVVLVLGALWLSYGFRDQEVNVLGTVVCGAFALKAFLTFSLARQGA